jgi:DNA-binding protein HU-beta
VETLGQSLSIARQNWRSIFKELCVNKSELIEAIAKETELSKATAGRALEVVLSTIVKTVAKKQDVQLIGFGTFKAAKRAARTGKNPRTGEKLKIAAATVPKFSAGAGFKAAVNKKK